RVRAATALYSWARDHFDVRIRVRAAPPGSRPPRTLSRPEGAQPMSATAPRFPFPAFPTGWFRVADARDLAVGSVRALHCLGQDLVLWRSADGAARVFDAHCPHLGAHLGVGGRMVDGALQCPFHGWRFDAGGACVGAPGRRAPTAGLRAWAVREW